MSDELLTEKLEAKMSHARTNYCSISVEEAPFSQLQRIAKKLGKRAEAGTLCHSLYSGGPEVQFGKKLKK